MSIIQQRIFLIKKAKCIILDIKVPFSKLRVVLGVSEKHGKAL